MLAIPWTNVAALNPEATRLNRTTAQQVVDAAKARRLDLARVHEKACGILAAIDNVQPKHATLFSCECECSSLMFISLSLVYISCVVVVSGR